MIPFSPTGVLAPEPPGLGPSGPFPRAPLTNEIDRRWLHYAFLSRDGQDALVANAAWLGPAEKGGEERFTTILLLHDRAEGWRASQFNAATSDPIWSAFRLPFPHHTPQQIDIAASDNAPRVSLDLHRTSRPCTSQSAFFAEHQHLRWQSETGVTGNGRWQAGAKQRQVDLVGYHERVRGRWSWPDLGEWVFGFANDLEADPGNPPEWAGVFTFIRPTAATDEKQASFMLWNKGRMIRHFPRRNVSFAVRGALAPDAVTKVPPLSHLLGVTTRVQVPRRLMITARMGDDYVVLDFDGETAARIVIPSENSFHPFSVHEVLGDCEMHGRVGGQRFRLVTRGIVEFAGGADHG